MRLQKIGLFLLLIVCLSSCISLDKRMKMMGPVNVGREYGSPSLPFVVSHLSKRNYEMLSRGRLGHHHMFNRILCFKKACRVKIGRTKALHPISFDKFKKKIKKNGKKGVYDKPATTDSVRRKSRPPQKKPLILPDTMKVPVIVEASPAIRKDSVIVLGGELLFATNSATLSSDHFEVLNSIVDYLTAHPTLFVKISGHTDNTGTESHNLRLSTQRADVVAEYLVDNGIDIDRVSSVGMGSSKPLGPNTSEAGRSKNRRVELLMRDGGR